MCGIIAVIAKRKVVSILIAGLKALSYRGYDSAGVALFSNNILSIIKSKGKIDNLENKIKNQNLNQIMGMGHTRWATHGKPTEINSHPHVANNTIAVVHNGIIDNYLSLKQELENLDLGYKFYSDTDTEVISVWLYHQVVNNKKTMLEALSLAREIFKGHFAFIVLDKNTDQTLYSLQCGSPLIFGIGIDENYVASDIAAFQSLTSKYIYSKPGDICIMTNNNIDFYDKNNNKIQREVICATDLLASDNASNNLSNNMVNSQDLKSGYKHFMLKEIMEQPEVIKNTIKNCFYNNPVELPKDAKNIHIVACGTSYYAGCVAKYWFEKNLDIPVSVEIASEYIYRKVAVSKNTVLILISQSGETADTLAVLRQAKLNNNYMGVLSICNVNHSTLVNESDWVCLTQAGPEYGVASTKAFTTQLMALSSLIINTNYLNNKNILQDIDKISGALVNILKYKNHIKLISKEIYEAHHALFLGRGDLYPIVLEGALKLKEISYIHAEAYAGGELKHGPLALVDSHMPVIILVDKNNNPEKICSNIQEVQARGGRVFIFSNDKNILSKISLQPQDRMLDLSLVFDDLNNNKIKDIGVFEPIIFVVVLQLLAYYTADFKGTDIDQPRNLAKSVTVE